MDQQNENKGMNEWMTHNIDRFNTQKVSWTLLGSMECNGMNIY